MVYDIGFIFSGYLQLLYIIMKIYNWLTLQTRSRSLRSKPLKFWYPKNKLDVEFSRGASNPSALLRTWPTKKLTPLEQFRYPPPHSHQFWLRSVKGPRRRRETNRQTNFSQIIVWYYCFIYIDLWNIHTQNWNGDEFKRIFPF